MRGPAANRGPISRAGRRSVSLSRRCFSSAAPRRCSSARSLTRRRNASSDSGLTPDCTPGAVVLRNISRNAHTAKPAAAAARAGRRQISQHRQSRKKQHDDDPQDPWANSGPRRPARRSRRSRRTPRTQRSAVPETRSIEALCSLCLEELVRGRNTDCGIPGAGYQGNLTGELRSRYRSVGQHGHPGTSIQGRSLTGGQARDHCAQPRIHRGRSVGAFGKQELGHAAASEDDDVSVGGLRRPPRAAAVSKEAMLCAHAPTRVAVRSSNVLPAVASGPVRSFPHDSGTASCGASSRVPFVVLAVAWLGRSSRGQHPQGTPELQ
jgi:hypothetical protein